MDGTPFTERDIIKLSKRINGINNELHIMVNKADMSTFQRTTLGRLVFQFRRWMIPYANRRFQPVMYNFDLEEFQEGYYRTTWRFLDNIKGDLVRLKFSLLSDKFKELNSVEKANLLRALAEVTQFFGLLLLIALLFMGGDDDKKPKDRSYASRLIEYQLRRLAIELGAFIPSPLMLSSLLTLLKSPMAGVEYVDKILDLFKVTSYLQTVESGRYAGHTNFYKYIMNLAPTNRTLYGVANPEEKQKYLLINQ